MVVYSKVSLLLINLVVVLSTIAQVYADSLPTVQDSLQKAYSVATDNFYSHHISAKYNIAKFKQNTSPKIVSDHRRAKGHNVPNTVVNIKGNKKDAQKLSEEFQGAISKGNGWYITTHKYDVHHMHFVNEPESGTPGMYRTKMTGYDKTQQFMYLVRNGKVNHFQPNCSLVAKTQNLKDDHCTKLNNDGYRYACKDSMTYLKNRKSTEKFKEMAYGRCRYAR
jgi:hypothetical protein